jgi:hypothetical protein
MQLRYADQLTDVAECPPIHASPPDQLAFRYVRDPVQCPGDFLPVAILQPNRQLDGTACCSAWALSFFETRDAAILRFAQLKRFVKQIHKKLGTHLAQVQLTQADGVATPPNEYGHFELFEDSGSDFSGRFAIVEQLP